MARSPQVLAPSPTSSSSSHGCSRCPRLTRGATSRKPRCASWAAGQNRQATVEDVREALAKITEGLSNATARQYVLVKSLLSYGHKLGYMPFNAGVTIKIRPDQSRGQLAKRIMPEVDVKLLIRQRARAATV